MIIPAYVPVAMGFVTLFFSMGQYVSPIITGFLIEQSQSYFTAFLFSGFTTLLGAFGYYRLQINNKKQIASPRVEAR